MSKKIDAEYMKAVVMLYSTKSYCEHTDQDLKEIEKIMVSCVNNKEGDDDD